MRKGHEKSLSTWNQYRLWIYVHKDWNGKCQVNNINNNINTDAYISWLSVRIMDVHNCYSNNSINVSALCSLYIYIFLIFLEKVVISISYDISIRILQAQFTYNGVSSIYNQIIGVCVHRTEVTTKCQIFWHTAFLDLFKTLQLSEYPDVSHHRQFDSLLN